MEPRLGTHKYSQNTQLNAKVIMSGTWFFQSEDDFIIEFFAKYFKYIIVQSSHTLWYDNFNTPIYSCATEKTETAVISNIGCLKIFLLVAKSKYGTFQDSRWPPTTHNSVNHLPRNKWSSFTTNSS